jgi:hypothetical protein
VAAASAVRWISKVISAPWDGQKVSQILYTSPIQTIAANRTLADIQFQFGPDLRLAHGQYVAFLSTAGLGFQGGLGFVMPFGKDLPDGGFVFDTEVGPASAQVLSALTTTDWACVLCGQPLNVWFKATLTEPVPTPPSLPLFATGLGLMALLAWHQRRKAAALLDASA